MVGAVSLDLEATPVATVSPSGPLFALPDDSGLAPLSLPDGFVQGRGGAAPANQPSADSIRRFEASMAAPAGSPEPSASSAATCSAPQASAPAPTPAAPAPSPAVPASPSVSRPLRPEDLPSLLPDDSGLVPLSLPEELLPPARFAVPVFPASRREPIVPVDSSMVDSLAPTRFFDAGNGVRLPYREHIPQAAAPESGTEPARVLFPLVLFLHGAGTRGTDGAAFEGNVSFKSLLARASGSEPAIVLAPQCPDDETWVDTPWSETTHVYRETPSRPMAAVLELLDRELSSRPVDRSRILVCGNSMGGYATWDLLSRRPDLFAAAIPVCGGGTPEKVAEASRTTPVWAVHGGADDTVPVENTRAIAEAVRADPEHAALFRYSELPGVGHDSWTATFTDPEVMDWFFAQRRTDVEASVATALSAVRQPAPLAGAAAPASASSSVSEAASARTAAVVETVDAIARAVAAEIAATPAIVRGEGTVVIRLTEAVLSGSEISLSAKDGKLSVEIAPATPQAAATIREALPDLETALAGHVSWFHSFSVALKKERSDETA